MARILRFYTYNFSEWSTRAETARWPAMKKSRAEAHRAYAHRQASMFLGLRECCATLWKDIPDYIKRMQDIIHYPRLADPGEIDRSELRHIVVGYIQIACSIVMH
jgi:hypothetical protein